MIGKSPLTILVLFIPLLSFYVSIEHYAITLNEKVVIEGKTAVMKPQPAISSVVYTNDHGDIVIKASDQFHTTEHMVGWKDIPYATPHQRKIPRFLPFVEIAVALQVLLYLHQNVILTGITIMLGLSLYSPTKIKLLRSRNSAFDLGLVCTLARAGI